MNHTQAFLTYPGMTAEEFCLKNFSRIAWEDFRKTCFEDYATVPVLLVKGSKKHLAFKKLFDDYFGFKEGSRGVTFPLVVRLLASFKSLYHS